MAEQATVIGRKPVFGTQFLTLRAPLDQPSRVTMLEDTFLHFVQEISISIQTRGQ